MPTSSTKALPKLLTALRACPQPALLDLGPVAGQNVTFFGEQLGCMMFVEDLFGDIDRHVTLDEASALPEFFASRLPQPDNSVDAILAWDVFDYIEPTAARALAEQLRRVLRPSGLLLAIFGPPPDGGESVYTKRIIVDERTLQHRSYPAARAREFSLLNRDILRLFAPLKVVEQFQLKSSVREVLFRKPAA